MIMPNGVKFSFFSSSPFPSAPGSYMDSGSPMDPAMVILVQCGTLPFMSTVMLLFSVIGLRVLSMCCASAFA